VVISYSTPLFTFSVPFILWAYMWILQRFRPIKRDLVRLRTLTRSPIFAHLSETLNGVPTIRAFGSVDAFIDTNMNKLEAGVIATYAHHVAGWWLNSCLGLLGTVVVVLALCSAMYAAYVSPSDASVVAQSGVSLTSALSFTGVLAVAVGAVANIEASFNAVDRLLHYSTEVEQEADDADAEVTPSEEWPNKGRIVVNNLKMRYRPSRPLVLRGVTFTVQGGERIGIVGRTGCGKSSLILSMMRLVEPEISGEGKVGPISVDGVDISKISLHKLRSSIGIVPQNPVFFSGTLRMNLDPLDKYTDADIWDVLDKCSLKSLVSSYEHKLQHEVREYAENLSQGQVRLCLCMHVCTGIVWNACLSWY
jgi:ABC-type multidrug transport system fused ATPase/permease subunit